MQQQQQPPQLPPSQRQHPPPPVPPVPPRALALASPPRVAPTQGQGGQGGAMQAEQVEGAPRVAVEGCVRPVHGILAAGELRAIAQRDLATDGDSDADDERERESMRLGAAHARMAADARVQAVVDESGPTPPTLPAAWASAEPTLPAAALRATGPLCPEEQAHVDEERAAGGGTPSKARGKPMPAIAMQAVPVFLVTGALAKKRRVDDALVRELVCATRTRFPTYKWDSRSHRAECVQQSILAHGDLANELSNSQSLELRARVSKLLLAEQVASGSRADIEASMPPDASAVTERVGNEPSTPADGGEVAPELAPVPLADDGRLEEALRVIDTLRKGQADAVSGLGAHTDPCADSTYEARVDGAVAILDALGPATEPLPSDRMEVGHGRAGGAHDE